MEAARASCVQSIDPTLSRAMNILGHTGDGQPVRHDQIPGSQLVAVDLDEARTLAVEQPGVVVRIEPSPQRVDGAPDDAQRRRGEHFHFTQIGSGQER